MLDELPVFGICGFSGSGKTTLIERVLPALIARGLRIAVLKHDVHGLATDAAAKDSERLFRAGADVVVDAPGQRLCREHDSGGAAPDERLAELAFRYDVVLVEGHKRLPVRKVWLSKSDGGGPAEGVGNVAAVLPWDGRRVETLLPMLEAFVASQWLRTPVLGCVTIGGASRRMGRPKHLLPVEPGRGQTWLERTVELLRGCCREVVVAGAGERPAALGDVAALPDVPDAEGPMAGLLAAMRWAPRASWLFAACDHPRLSAEALHWLLSLRRPGIWAALPRRGEAAAPEPLLAHYDPRSRAAIETMAFRGKCRLADLAGHSKVAAPIIPDALAAAWADADTPGELG
jgi:molybdopterin-guanine dinucleotide biosynthesis protein MobB